MKITDRWSWPSTCSLFTACLLVLILSKWTRLHNYPRSHPSRYDLFLTLTTSIILASFSNPNVDKCVILGEFTSASFVSLSLSHCNGSVVVFPLSQWNPKKQKPKSLSQTEITLSIRILSARVKGGWGSSMASSSSDAGLKSESGGGGGSAGGEASEAVMANDQLLLYRGLKKAKKERGCTAKERISKMPPCAAGKRSSIYRGVTRYYD